MSRLASAWLNSEYADAEALILLHETGGELSDTCLLVARLPVHRLILAAVRGTIGPMVSVSSCHAHSNQEVNN
jgi:hypothetical protein